jgi:hypothetical protein
MAWARTSRGRGLGGAAVLSAVVSVCLPAQVPATEQVLGAVHVVEVPDLQYATRDRPEAVPQIVDGILRFHARTPIDVVTFVGDLTWDDKVEQYEPVLQGIRRLHAAGIPVVVVPGNHDYQGHGWPDDRKQSNWHRLMRRFAGFPHSFLGKNMLLYGTFSELTSPMGRSRRTTEHSYGVVATHAARAHSLGLLNFGFLPPVEMMQRGVRWMHEQSRLATLQTAHAGIEANDGRPVELNPHNPRTNRDPDQFGTDGTDLRDQVYRGNADRIILGIFGHRRGMNDSVWGQDPKVPRSRGGTAVLVRNFQHEEDAGLMKLTHLRFELLGRPRHPEEAAARVTAREQGLEARARVVANVVDARSWRQLDDGYQRQLNRFAARLLFRGLGRPRRVRPGGTAPATHTWGRRRRFRPGPRTPAVRASAAPRPRNGR